MGDLLNFHRILFGHEATPEQAIAYEDAIREAETPGLGEDRMRDIVQRALAPQHTVRTARSQGTLADLLVAELLACKVLARGDCPHDLLMEVVVSVGPEANWGAALRQAVLERIDCPDGVRVAAVLAGPASP